MANFHPSETYADDKVTISSARLFVFEPEAGPADAASSTATKRRYFFHVIASNDPRLAVSIDVKYEDWHGYIHDSRPNIVDTLDFEWRMDNRPNERPAWVLPETLTPKLYTEISFQCERNLDLQPSQGHDPFEDEYEDLSDASYAVEGTLTIHDLGDSEALA